VTGIYRFECIVIKYVLVREVERKRAVQDHSLEN